MLKIKKVLQENVTFNLETDFYIPIMIEFPSNDISTDEIYYYRVFNEKSSFIEIKVNSKSHKIYSINVISINDLLKHTTLQLNYDNLPVCRGNPIIDVDMWNNSHIIDVNNNFSVALNEDKMFILFENIRQAAWRLILPNIELLVTQNNCVVGYIFYDIPLSRKKDLEDGIAASISI